MSRIALEPKDQKSHPEIYCGLDTCLGWFIQVFGPRKEDGEDNLLIDKDSRFSNLNREELVNLIQRHAVNNKRTQHVINQITLDLDPEIDLSFYS